MWCLMSGCNMNPRMLTVTQNKQRIERGCQICTKSGSDRPQIEQKSGTFSDQISVHLARRAKMY